MPVLQLSRELTERPPAFPVEGTRLRSFVAPSDIEPWLELRRQAFARQKLGVREWTAGDFTVEFLQKPWWRADRMWLVEEVAIDAPRLLGAITLAWRGDESLGKPAVHWLLVRPGFRRRGIARLLLATLECAAWDTGCRRVWLETHADWIEAAQFYHSAAYVETRV